jgi:hypothetical protein
MTIAKIPCHGGGRGFTLHSPLMRLRWLSMVQRLNSAV